MMNTVTILIGLSTLSCLTGAIIITNFDKISSSTVTDVVPCGVNATGADYCAARVNNGQCEPLTRGWCASHDMSIAGTYLIKTSVIEILQTTLIDRYIRHIPIYLSDGSEIELKFMLHTNWTGLNLIDDLNNIGLHVNLSPSGDFYTSYKLDGQSWASKEGYTNSFTHNVNAEYTLGIRCDTGSFLIYYNGQYEFSQNYVIPLNDLTEVNQKFKGVEGNMYKVTYRTGL